MLRIGLLLIPILLVLSIVAVLNPKSASVLGVSAVAFKSQAVNWEKKPQARIYQIFYGPKSNPGFAHSVVIPAKDVYPSYTINFLKKNVNYDFEVAAIDGGGVEIWRSGRGPLK